MSARRATDGTRHGADTIRDRPGVDVTTAARLLGITPDAARGRLRRGSLPGTLLPGGRWVVHIDPDLSGGATATGHRHGSDTASHGAHAAVVEVLQAQVADLQRRLDRQDVLMQSLIAKLPNADAAPPVMIEAAGHRPDAVENADVSSYGAEPAVMGQDASPSFIAALLRRLLRRDPPQPPRPFSGDGSAAKMSEFPSVPSADVPDRRG